MEKAFDRVSYDFINDALEALDFGENFRSYVNMMYRTDAEMRRRSAGCLCSLSCSVVPVTLVHDVHFVGSLSPLWTVTGSTGARR